MTRNEAVESLEHIRGVLERATRYHLICWRGILLAGVVALAAAAAGHLQDVSPLTRPAAFLGLWGGAFIAALAAGWWTTTLKARAAGETVWSRKLQAAGVGVSPAFLAGLLLTALLANVGRVDLVPGVWMALYGVGILAVQHWLDWEFHLTAWAFLACSAVALFLLPQSPHVALAISFGGIHLVLGVHRAIRERS